MIPPHHKLFNRFSLQQLVLMAAIPLLLGFVIQWFFYEHELGLNVPTGIALGLMGFFCLFYRRLSYRAYFGWFLLVLSVILSLVFVIWNSAPILAINFLLIPLLLLSGIALVSGWARRSWDDIAFVEEFFPRGLVGMLESVPLPFLSVRHLAGHHQTSRRPIITGILLSLPIIIVISMLLASGDAVFSHSISFLTEHIDLSEDLIGRTILFSLASLFFACLAWMLMKEPSQETKPALELKKNASMYLSIPTFVLLNLLYLFFFFIQFKYLLGGADLSFLDNMTFAEYARRGFGELLAVAAINFLLVSVCSSATAFASTGQKLFFRALASLTVFFTFLMLISSHLRLGYYIDAYGFTYTRFFVQVFLAALAIYLVFLTVKLWYESFALKKAMILFTLVLWTVLSFSNIDQIVLQRNIRLFEKEKRIDYPYLLLNLSDDVLPQTVAFMQSQGFAPTIDDLGMLGMCKNQECFYLPDLDPIDHWQEWNHHQSQTNAFRHQYGLIDTPIVRGIESTERMQ